MREKPLSSGTCVPLLTNYPSTREDRILYSRDLEYDHVVQLRSGEAGGGAAFIEYCLKEQISHLIRLRDYLFRIFPKKMSVPS